MTQLSIQDSLVTAAHEAVESALELASTAGAASAEAALSAEVGLSVTARRRELETLEFQNDRGFVVTVYVDGSKGSASTSDLSADAIAATVHKAVYIARQTEPDPYAGLADATLMATDFPALDLDHGWDLDADRAGTLACETEAAALDADPRISNSDGATVSTQRGLALYANSHGFRGCERRSMHSISCAVIAGKDDGMERDYSYTAARDPALLDDALSVGREAAARAVQRLHPVKLETRDAPVLFRADLATGFVGHLLAAISGGAQYRKATFLLDAVGEAVLPPAISITEQPHLPRAVASAGFDGEGVATRERDIVAEGILQGYILSSYSARRLGLQTTGNAGGVHNAVVSGGGGDLAAMLRQLDTGLFVTELMGQGVNLVTGDYSRGAAGFWVENGEIVHPVSEVTIAGNLRSALRGIVAVGDDTDTRGRIRSGSLLLESLKIAGT